MFFCKIDCGFYKIDFLKFIKSSKKTRDIMSDFKLPQRPNCSDDWTDMEYINFLESVEIKAEQIIGKFMSDSNEYAQLLFKYKKAQKKIKFLEKKLLKS